MASRKPKPKKATRVHVGRAALDRSELTLTREVDVLTVAQLAALARDSAPPAPPRGEVSVEDLAQTIEAPATSHGGILDVAERLVGHVEFALLTPRQVADAAGVGLDVFHAHFSDMHALLGALNERLSAEAIAAAVEAAGAGRGGAQSVAAAARAAGAAVLSRAPLVRAVLASKDSTIVEELRGLGKRIATRLGPALGAQRFDRDDLVFAVQLSLAVVHERITVGGGLSFERDELLDRASAAVSTFLAGRRPPARSRSSGRS
jgi:AcrR family transcriptional regulator